MLRRLSVPYTSPFVSLSMGLASECGRLGEVGWPSAAPSEPDAVYGDTGVVAGTDGELRRPGPSDGCVPGFGDDRSCAGPAGSPGGISRAILACSPNPTDEWRAASTPSRNSRKTGGFGSVPGSVGACGSGKGPFRSLADTGPLSRYSSRTGVAGSPAVGHGEAAKREGISGSAT